MGHSGSSTSVALHDPLCVWWVLDSAKREAQLASAHETEGRKRPWRLSPPTDIRIETMGQWSRGACVVDRRDRQRETESIEEAENLGERDGDSGAWLSNRRGNRVHVAVDTPGKDVFVDTLLATIFGLERQ